MKSPIIKARYAPLIVLALALSGRARALPVCSSPPLFDLSGSTCSATKQNAACGCSECMLWDASQGATWYEVRRCNTLDGTCLVTGDTRWKNRTGYQAKMWCAAWDAPFPLPGVAYDYSVRACKDGPTGPICSTALSNNVRYVGAPYMCISGGVEVACSSFGAAKALSGSTDLDDDGTPDATDSDDDGDSVLDAADNCVRNVNIGQRDADNDGVGDACDLEPLWPSAQRSTGEVQADGDADDDGIGDRADVCPAIYDPLQGDQDADRIGDACDNCPAQFNEMQSDSDDDGEGDRCDLNDTLLSTIWKSKARLAWEPEWGFTAFSVYRGDLTELKLRGEYTQGVGDNALAAQWCGVTATEMDDADAPKPGQAAFYLVAGRGGSLGTDGEGAERLATRSCP